MAYFDCLLKVFLVFLCLDLVYDKDKSVCVFEVVRPEVWVLSTQVPHLKCRLVSQLVLEKVERLGEKALFSWFEKSAKHAFARALDSGHHYFVSSLFVPH